MKKRKFIAVMLILLIMISGCAVKEDNYDREPVYGEAKSIIIMETGGEDGRDLVWQINEMDGKYYFSVDNMKYDRHLLQEITEEEYRSVMCINYEEYFEKNIRDNTVIMDDVYHHTIIEFENNKAFESDDYYMTKIIQLMYDIASKYDTCDFTDFYY